MYIVKKRLNKAKFKQRIEIALYKLLTVIGLVTLIGLAVNYGINYISEVQWFVPKEVSIVIAKDVANVVDSQDETVLDDSVEGLKVISMAGEDSLTPITPAVPLIEKIEKVFGEEAPIAIAVAQAESSMQPDRIGDNHLKFEDGKYGMSCGLFQIRILPGRPTCEEMLDPQKNIEFAYELHKKSGWNPWSVYKNGQYLKFIN